MNSRLQHALEKEEHHRRSTDETPQLDEREAAETEIQLCANILCIFIVFVLLRVSQPPGLFRLVLLSIFQFFFSNQISGKSCFFLSASFTENVNGSNGVHVYRFEKLTKSIKDNKRAENIVETFIIHNQ